jgi:hypothetical protein
MVSSTKAPPQDITEMIDDASIFMFTGRGGGKGGELAKEEEPGRVSITSSHPEHHSPSSVIHAHDPSKAPNLSCADRGAGLVWWILHPASLPG